MNVPTVIKSPPHRILRCETEWAIRESILRANDILGPDGIIVKTVIPALVSRIAEISHPRQEKVIKGTKSRIRNIEAHRANDHRNGFHATLSETRGDC